jgi:hypothetical protein
MTDIVVVVRRGVIAAGLTGALLFEALSPFEDRKPHAPEAPPPASRDVSDGVLAANTATMTVAAACSPAPGNLFVWSVDRDV